MTIPFVQGSTGPDPSQDSTQRHGKTPIRQAIEEFLTATSSTALCNRLCPHCGRTMRHVNATFSLFGSDKQWKVPLPACPCGMGTSSAKEKRA